MNLLTDWLTDLLTYSLTYLPTYLPTHSLPHSLTYLLTYWLTCYMAVYEICENQCFSEFKINSASVGWEWQRYKDRYVNGENELYKGAPGIVLDLTTQAININVCDPIRLESKSDNLRYKFTKTPRTICSVQIGNFANLQVILPTSVSRRLHLPVYDKAAVSSFFREFQFELRLKKCSTYSEAWANKQTWLQRPIPNLIPITSWIGRDNLRAFVRLVWCNKV